LKVELLSQIVSRIFRLLIQNQVWIAWLSC